MPTLTQLEYILAVQRNGHFGRAAQDCHVSQPSLSTQIQKVEEELGFTLFDRSKKPILVTQKGALFMEQAQVILKEHKKLFEISQQNETVSGDFRLGIIPTLAPYLLPLFVERFSKSFPSVQLHILEQKTEDLLRDLHQDRVDAALLVTPLKDPKIHERVLFYEPFWIFASSDHPLSQKKRIKDSDLKDHPIWLLSEGHCLRHQTLNVCSVAQQSRVLDNVHFESGNLETLIQLIRNGSGYTLLPQLALGHLTAREKKENLKGLYKASPAREVSLVHSRRYAKKSVIDALEETLTKELPKDLVKKKKDDWDVIDL